MGRIKVNLASGNVFDKPLVTCFKGTNGNYIVLDNELNGTMGLPIICIGRLEGSTINKIVDSTEWTSVKENLKTIIGGTALPYLNVPENLSASDDFYTQLTLPIASFELLKNTYKVEEVKAEEPAPVVQTPVAPEPAVETPIIPTAEVIAPVQPVVPEAEPVPETVVPVVETPASSEVVPTVDITSVPVEPIPEPTPIIPQEPEIPVEEVPVASSEPIVPFEINPEINVAPTTNINDQELVNMKETFMKSCENMFDALVEKLKK